MKLQEYGKQKPCYYCGADGPSTREHVPPQMMFAGFARNSITVPSCDKHNTKKSIGDRAIITALIMSASQMFKHRDTLHIYLTPNVITAIKKAEPYFDLAKNDVRFRDFLIDPPDDLDIPLPYLELNTNIREWFKQLTAALIWSIVGRHDPNLQWDNASVGSLGFVETAGPITFQKAVSIRQKNANLERQFNEMQWYSGWSATPKSYPDDIYSFDLSFSENIVEGVNVFFRHRFYYNTSVWYVLFKAPPEIVDTLVAATNIVA